MILDGSQFFEPLAGTAITVSAYSTNVYDLVVNRDFGGGANPPQIVAAVLASFASSTPSATLTIGVQGAPDNGSGSPGGFQTVEQTPAVPLGQLQAGQRPMKIGLASVSEMPLPAVFTTGTTTLGGNTMMVGSATGLTQGQNIFGNPNVPPGTTIASISGTTVTMSTGTGVTPGTAVATRFGAPQPMPRFLQLIYTCSATFTAGKLWAGITDLEELPAIYPAGYTWPTAPAGVWI
jgi:hypothetical protein